MVTTKAKLELFRRKIHLLDEGQAVWVVRQLMKQLAEEDPKSYITDSMLKPGIVSIVHRAISDIRLAGIQAVDVEAKQFANLDKGEYMQRLLAQYEAYLREHCQTDVAGLAEYYEARRGQYRLFGDYADRLDTRRAAHDRKAVWCSSLFP